MRDTHEIGRGVVDRSLERAGLTRLLGPHGEGRGTVLGVALALLVCAGLTLVLFAWPPTSIGMAFIVPVVLVATEFGVRAGLLCAAGSTGMLLVWALATDGHDQGLAGVLIGSLALVFLAWAVGRISERAVRSRRLLEQVIESTSDSIYVAESTRFFDLSGDMLCTVGFDGALHRVNDEWEKTLGWSSDELLGRSIFDYMAPEDHQAASDATRAARVPNAPGAQLTTRLLAKDGSWHWIDWSLRTVDDERRVYASGRDVTQRRAAKRALTRSESRYRASSTGCRGRRCSSSTTI